MAHVYSRYSGDTKTCIRCGRVIVSGRLCKKCVVKIRDGRVREEKKVVGGRDGD